MYKGNKSDRLAGLHYQCVTEVSENINANANIKVFQIKLKTESTTHIHTYTQVALMTFCFFMSGPQTKQLGRPWSRVKDRSHSGSCQLFCTIGSSSVNSMC